MVEQSHQHPSVTASAFLSNGHRLVLWAQVDRETLYRRSNFYFATGLVFVDDKLF